MCMAETGVPGFDGHDDPPPPPLPPILLKFGGPPGPAPVAGEFRADPPRGEGRDRFEVGLLGLPGVGDCVAMGTEADRWVWW